ncbi:putative chromatin regulator PHD family [Arabidopsis thaliana]
MSVHVKEPVCETCGDIGFEEALVFCDSCKIESIHRYCIGITPTPFTEYITWICEDCDESDSDSDCKELDQTAKLTHILKKSDKKKKKRKKKSKYLDKYILKLRLFIVSITN